MSKQVAEITARAPTSDALYLLRDLLAEGFSLRAFVVPCEGGGSRMHVKAVREIASA